MKKRIAMTLLALSVAAAIPVQAQEADTGVIEGRASAQQLDQAASSIAEAAQPQVADPGMKIDELIQEFENSPQGSAFVNNESLFYTTAMATVMVKPEHREWGNARVLAYKEAMIKAQANYIRSLGLKISTESAMKMFDDKSQMPSFSEAELRSTSKLAELFDKAIAVAGGKLDAQLEEMNIDPAEFRAAPDVKRAELYNRSISQTTLSRGRAELTGIIPVKTFEAFNEDGDHVVAVAMVASPRFRQFVHDIIESKGDVNADPAKASPRPLRELLRENPLALIDDFGIRRMYDDQGYPVLVSFGQSSNPYRGNDFQQRADNRELSFIAARAESFANFANLFKASGMVNEAVTQRASRTTTGVAVADGRDVTLSEETSTEIVRAINSEISTRGSVSDLAGTKELFRWTQKHPQHGHEINGVVFIWHPKAEQQARNLRDFKPTRKSQTAEQPQDRGSSQAGTRQSRDLMSADDF